MVQQDMLVLMTTISKLTDQHAQPLISRSKCSGRMATTAPGQGMRLGLYDGESHSSKANSLGMWQPCCGVMPA
jgi:hypothetical protein